MNEILITSAQYYFQNEIRKMMRVREEKDVIESQEERFRRESREITERLTKTYPSMETRGKRIKDYYEPGMFIDILV